MHRAQVLEKLAECMVEVPARHPLRVAIDGIDAAGKSTLADELVPPIEALGRPVIRVSIDGFHRPREERYRRGKHSAKGYYDDSFDDVALVESLLLPLGPGGTRLYRPAVFDHVKDQPVHGSSVRAPDHAILLVDGIFLLRPELDRYWDYRIFVQVSFEVALERALERDVPLIGSSAGVRDRYLRRYFPAQRLYLNTVDPEHRADVVLENDDPRHLRIRSTLPREA